jgi:hypothetical protein
VAPLACFFFSYCFSCKILTPEKSLGQFEFWKVLEISKYKKQVFPVLQSYNKKDGSIENPHKSM